MSHRPSHEWQTCQERLAKGNLAQDVLTAEQRERRMREVDAEVEQLVGWGSEEARNVQSRSLGVLCIWSQNSISKFHKYGTFVVPRTSSSGVIVWTGHSFTCADRATPLLSPLQRPGERKWLSTGGGQCAPFLLSAPPSTGASPSWQWLECSFLRWCWCDARSFAYATGLVGSSQCRLFTLHYPLVPTYLFS